MSEPPLPSTHRRFLLAKYGPLATVPFYFGFSSHFISPSGFSKVFGAEMNSTMANTFCLGSHLGVAAYLFTSKHLRNCNGFMRFLYSIYGSTLFNFGTVVMMSVIRSIFQLNSGLRFCVGLTTASAVLLIGKQYVDYVDQVFNEIRFRTRTQSFN